MVGAVRINDKILRLQSMLQSLILPVRYVVFIISVVINFPYFSKTVMRNSEAVERLSVQTRNTQVKCKFPFNFLRVLCWLYNKNISLEV
jgi:hypothetical protein